MCEGSDKERTFGRIGEAYLWAPGADGEGEEEMNVGDKIHFWFYGKRYNGTIIAIRDGTYIIDSCCKEYKTTKSEALHEGWVLINDNPDCCEVRSRASPIRR